MTVNVFDRAKPSGLKNTENLQTEMKGKELRAEAQGCVKQYLRSAVGSCWEKALEQVVRAGSSMGMNCSESAPREGFH